MTAEERAELVERVAMAIEQVDNERVPDGFYTGSNPAISDWSAYLATAAIDIIRAEVLEEAARVFDEMWGGITPDEAAAAIRARKEKING